MKLKDAIKPWLAPEVPKSDPIAMLLGGAVGIAGAFGLLDHLSGDEVGMLLGSSFTFAAGVRWFWNARQAKGADRDA